MASNGLLFTLIIRPSPYLVCMRSKIIQASHGEHHFRTELVSLKLITICSGFVYETGPEASLVLFLSSAR